MRGRLDEGLFFMAIPMELNMSDYFAALPTANSTFLCVGSITRSEAELVRQTGLSDDGHGYYLFLAREDAPGEPLQVLAKFVSPLEAERVARILNAKAAS
jgi:hypothetical protein